MIFLKLLSLPWGLCFGGEGFACHDPHNHPLEKMFVYQKSSTYSSHGVNITCETHLTRGKYVNMLSPIIPSIAATTSISSSSSISTPISSPVAATSAVVVISYRNHNMTYFENDFNSRDRFMHLLHLAHILLHHLHRAPCSSWPAPHLGRWLQTPQCTWNPRSLQLVPLTCTINVPGAHVPLVHPQCIILVVKSLQLHIGITSSSREMILITISLQHFLHDLPLTTSSTCPYHPP